MEKKLQRIIDATEGKRDSFGYAQLKESVPLNDDTLWLDGVQVAQLRSTNHTKIVLWCSTKDSSAIFAVHNDSPLYLAMIDELCKSLDNGYEFEE